MSEIFLSELRYLMPDSDDLHQASISATRWFPNFAGVREHILQRLRFPQKQSGKFNCYGYAPALYIKKLRTSHAGKEYMAHWRCAESEGGEIYLFYADLDNDQPFPKQEIEDVVERLLMHGLNFFYHTTYSHTPAHPKVRIIIEISRPISREEMMRLFVWLNWEVFGSQGDPSIYSPGDYVYGPPHECETGSFDGLPIDVDAMLGWEAELREAHPESWARAERATRTARPHRILTLEEQAAVDARKADLSVRARWVTIKNPAVFNPAWRDDYLTRDRPGVLGSHWKAMRSILGSVWTKAKGELTWGEMIVLFDEIDATDGGYFRKKYEPRRIDELIDWVMSNAPEAINDNDPGDDGGEPDGPATETADEAPQDAPAGAGKSEKACAAHVIKGVEGDCGGGKTSQMLAHIAATGGRWIYAVDRIELIPERWLEFSKRHRRAGMSFRYYPCHSRKDAEDANTVPGQIVEVRKAVDREWPKNVLMFVTHAALAMMPWSDWTDFKLVIDEVIDVWQASSLRLAVMHETVKKCFAIDSVDGDYYILKLTTLGRQWAADEGLVRTDEMIARFAHLLDFASEKNRLLWVHKEGWDDPADHAIRFHTLVTPELLAPFIEVWMIGDELSKSLTYELWRERYGVDWQMQPFTSSRVRTVPLRDRAMIHYYAKKDASFTRFRQLGNPVMAIAEHLSATIKRPFIWTVNKEFLASASDLTGHYLTPKQTGTNEWAHITEVVWLAAMKTSTTEGSEIKRLCGMTLDEIARWRERNAMHQFIMRTAIRDFASSEVVNVHVFSEQQARYESERLGGCPIVYVENVVEEPVVKMGRPPSGLTATERKQKQRAEKAKDVGREPGKAGRPSFNPSRKSLAEKAKDEGRDPKNGSSQPFNLSQKYLDRGSKNAPDGFSDTPPVNATKKESDQFTSRTDLTTDQPPASNDASSPTIEQSGEWDGVFHRDWGNARDAFKRIRWGS